MICLLTPLRKGLFHTGGTDMLQVYARRNTWCKASPMVKKSEAHETLSLLFVQEGVTSTLVMDRVREQAMGEFRHKARQADCLMK